MPTFTFDETGGGSFEPHRSGMTVTADEAYYDEATGQQQYGDTSYDRYEQGGDWEDDAYSQDVQESRFDDHVLFTGNQEQISRYWLSPGGVGDAEMAFLIGEYEESLAAGYMNEDDIDRIGMLLAFKNGQVSLQELAHSYPQVHQELASAIHQFNGSYSNDNQSYDEDEDDDDDGNYSEAGADYAEITENINNMYGMDDFEAAKDWFAEEFGPENVAEFNRMIDEGEAHEIQSIISQIMEMYYAGDRNTYDY